jgi:hypothetical protein
VGYMQKSFNVSHFSNPTQRCAGPGVYGCTSLDKKFD